MFDSKHYVPILKWKRAEQGALQALADEYRNYVTPLIELVMPKPKSLSKSYEKLFQELVLEFKTKRISEIPEEIIRSWGTRPAFIDFSLLYSIELKVESIRNILEKAKECGASLVPVMNLSDNEAIKNEMRRSLKNHDRGICLRIVPSELEDINKLNKDIDGILHYLDTGPDNIDLLIDIKEIKENGAYYSKYANISQGIKSLDRWRTYIFASGAFPENLSEFTVDEPGIIPRIEWMGWVNLKNRQIKRIPTFSDYTVRNPIYNESLQFYHATSSIKYALEDAWLILKGRIKQFEIYLASAAELKKDARFYGENFSSGDQFIAEKAKHFEQYIRNPKIKGTGNTEMWLRAFINHHLTLTAHQIASLP